MEQNQTTDATAVETEAEAEAEGACNSSGVDPGTDQNVKLVREGMEPVLNGGPSPQADPGESAGPRRRTDKPEKPAVKIPEVCRDLDLESMSETELAAKVKAVHAKSLEFLRKTSGANANARVCAWTAGRILLRMKEAGPKQRFRTWAKAVTKISDPTITRYMSIARAYPDLDSLLGSTESLRDAYLKTGQIKDSKTGEATAPPTPVEKLSRIASSFQKELRAAVQKGLDLSPPQLNQLRLIVEELKGFLEKLPDNEREEVTS